MSADEVVNEYAADVPLSATLFHVVPLSMLYCHWNDGAGTPVAATVNDAALPAVTFCGDGFEVMATAVHTPMLTAVE